MKIRSVLALSALSLASITIGVTSEPAAAVGCTGTGCDNKGPKGNGCFNDDKTIASGGGGDILLRYSDACHAMWAYGPYAPQFWDVELQIEMQHYYAPKDQWVAGNPARLTTVFEAQGGPDWTNALGARNSDYRFRAIYYDQPGGNRIEATPWARGGNW